MAHGWIKGAQNQTRKLTCSPPTEEENNTLIATQGDCRSAPRAIETLV